MERWYPNLVLCQWSAWLRTDWTGRRLFCGGAVSSAGDINGDGLDDFLVGAPSAFISWGKPLAFGSNQSGAWGSGVLNLTAFADGKRGFVLLGKADDSNVQSVSGVGDINGDGLEDILIGAPGYSGCRKNHGGIGLTSTRRLGLRHIEFSHPHRWPTGLYAEREAGDQSGYPYAARVISMAIIGMISWGGSI